MHYVSQSEASCLFLSFLSARFASRFSLLSGIVGLRREMQKQNILLKVICNVSYVIVFIGETFSRWSGLINDVVCVCIIINKLFRRLIVLIMKQVVFNEPSIY